MRTYARYTVILGFLAVGATVATAGYEMLTPESVVAETPQVRKKIVRYPDGKRVVLCPPFRCRPDIPLWACCRLVIVRPR